MRCIDSTASVGETDVAFATTQPSKDSPVVCTDATGCSWAARFGGSVWALSRADEAEALREQWEAAYLQAFPARSGVATFFVMAPGPGACCV